MTTEKKRTEFEEILHDLHGGVFVQKIGIALSDVSEGVCLTGRKGKVTVTFDVKKISDTQVQIDHTVNFTAPKQNGHVAEKDTTATPMYVGARGRLSLFPEAQPDLMTGKVSDHERRATS